MTYRRNKDLKDMIGGTTIESNKLAREQKPILTSGYCKSWFL